MRNIIPMELTDLNSAIPMKLRPTYGGPSGRGVVPYSDIATFETNIAYPLKKLLAKITAQQDLNGYDYPWVGGAGKNILDCGEARSETVTDITFTFDADGGIHLSGTASANRFRNLHYTQGVQNIPVGVPLKLVLDKTSEIAVAVCYAGSDNATHILISRTNQGQYSFTLPSDAVTTWVRIYASAGVTYSDSNVIHPMIVANSVTDYSFAPYKNICPISGWSEVNVTRTGKNMFDISTFSANDCMYQLAESFTNGIGSATLTKNEDSFTLVRVSTSYTYFICVGKCFANIPVTISFSVTEGYVFDINARTEPPTQAPNNDKRFYRDTTVSGQASVTRTFTPEQDGYVYIEIYGTSGNLTNTIANLQYEFGSTKTDYERGNKQTYTIDLDGTCYGGTLDVTTGKLTITHGSKLISECNWTYDANYTRMQSGSFSDIKTGYAVRTVPLLCSAYQTIDDGRSLANVPNGSIYGAGSSITVYIKDTSYTNADTFKTAMGDERIVYPLATPQTVQLTPTEVMALLGQNNIWANSGQVYVEYHFVEDFEE